MPTIGQWCNGETIDITGVPLTITPEYATGIETIQPYAAANGGMFDAVYRFLERRDNGRWVYELHRVEEIFPPTPPQLRAFDESVRVPGRTVAEEIALRRHEWAEVLSAR